jgi:hypothetical protein
MLDINIFAILLLLPNIAVAEAYSIPCHMQLSGTKSPHPSRNRSPRLLVRSWSNDITSWRYTSEIVTRRKSLALFAVRRRLEVDSHLKFDLQVFE